MERSRSQHRKRRKTPAADLRRRLPERLRRGQARLRTEAGRRLHQLLDDQTALLPVRQRPRAQADRRPRVLRRRPLHQRDRAKKRPHKGTVIKVPAGTIVVSEQPSDKNGATIEGDRQGRLVRDQGQPGAVGHRNHQPGRESRQNGEPAVIFEFTDKGREAFQEVTRKIAQRGQAAAIGRLRRRRSRTALRPLRRRPRQRSQDAADHQLRSRTPTGSTAAPAPRSPAASPASPKRRNSRPSCRSAPCRST